MATGAYLMKRWPIFFFLMSLLAGCASQPPGAAYSYPADAPAAPGKITFYIVTGGVQLRAADGTMHPVKRGEQFAEGNTIIAEKGGNALLVFSNGTTLKVLEGTELAVVKFRQAAFDEKAEGTYLRLSKDPSRSNVLLDLRKGTLQGEVKKLNTEAGSSFVVLTPAGAVDVRNGQPLQATAMGGPRSIIEETPHQISITMDVDRHITAITPETAQARAQAQPLIDALNETINAAQALAH